MKKKIHIILILLLFSCSSKKYTIRDAAKGIVHDIEKLPIEGVEVRFIDNDSYFKTNPVKTNNKGMFFIEGIKTDDYKQYGMLGPEIPFKIVLSKTGYKNDTINIKQFDKNLSRNMYEILDLGKIYMIQN